MCHEIEWVAVRSVESEKGRKDMHSTGSRADGDYLEVHIDETGDRGTKPSSSPYFFMTACAFRTSDRQLLNTAIQYLNEALKRPLDHVIHAVRHLRDHEKLIEASERLAAIKTLRIFFVIIPKDSILKDTHLRLDTGYMYNFTSHLMLERISWFASSMGLSAQPTFASVRRLPHKNLDNYISLLKGNETKINWDWLKLPVSVIPANERIGLQWADIAGRALLRALVPSAKPPHRIEPIYLKALAPIIWGERPLESHGIYCIERRWHERISWWRELEALVPENNLLG